MKLWSFTLSWVCVVLATVLTGLVLVGVSEITGRKTPITEAEVMSLAALVLVTVLFERNFHA